MSENLQKLGDTQVEYDGGGRQTGKTTRALRDCQAASKTGCNAVYIAHDADMAHNVVRMTVQVTGESPQFKVMHPTQVFPRGMRPDLVVIDCYDILKPKVLYELETSIRLAGTRRLRLIHSGKD